MRSASVSSGASPARQSFNFRTLLSFEEAKGSGHYCIAEQMILRCECTFEGHVYDLAQQFVGYQGIVVVVSNPVDILTHSSSGSRG